MRFHLAWWPTWLDRGTLTNVDAPECGVAVVRGLTGHKYEGFRHRVQLYPKVSSPKVPTSRGI